MADQILFKFKEYVQLWQTDRNVPNINGPMIQYNTKIYKGATNTIDFVVRNNDRKPVNLVGYQIEVFIQRVDDEVLLKKYAYPLDERSGKCQLILLPTEIENWLPGFYRYTVRLTDVTGKTEFLYTDINRSTFNQFELFSGIESSIKPATTILQSEFTPTPSGLYETTYNTGALIGNAQLNRSSGMHTFVVYTKNKFIGKFWIQASLSMDSPTVADWFDVPFTSGTPTFDYTELTTAPILSFNVVGNYCWLRAFYSHTPPYTGEFVKLLYKN